MIKSLKIQKTDNFLTFQYLNKSMKIHSNSLVLKKQQKIGSVAYKYVFVRLKIHQEMLKPNF